MRGSKQHGRRWDAWKVTTLVVMGEEQLCYYNNRYHVFLRRSNVEGVPYPVIHLSVKNNDRSPMRDWRDLQRIKNEIAGEEIEMVEIFPRESNKVDISNQYHLWGYETADPVLGRFGLGFHSGRMVWNGTDPRPQIPDTEQAVQRPSDEESAGF